MKVSLVSLALVAAAAAMPTASYADVAFNGGVVTDYRYRGISQSRLKPAVQGGLDFTQSAEGGFYLGAWGSSIKWIKDGGGDGSLELDLYGGYKGELTPGVNYDVGVLRYQYPSNKLPVSANTTEIYGALTFGMFTAKYSHSTSNLFGFSDSKGSGYLDLSAAIDLGDGLSLTPHVGRQTVKKNTNYSYTDYSLTLAKDFSGTVVSAAIVGTDTKDYLSPAGKNLGKSALVLGVKVNF